MDYKKLLTKYLNHVMEQEGIDFTGNSLTASIDFSDEEKKELRTISHEIDNWDFT